MFPLYPARPEVFRQLLEALGEPTLLEVEIAVECGAVRALTALDMAGRCVVRYSLKPAPGRALELYSEYYKSYRAVSRRVMSFKAYWHGKNYTAEFDGFRLKITAHAPSPELLRILKLPNWRIATIEVDLAAREQH